VDSSRMSYEQTLKRP